MELEQAVAPYVIIYPTYNEEVLIERTIPVHRKTGGQARLGWPTAGIRATICGCRSIGTKCRGEVMERLKDILTELCEWQEITILKVQSRKISCTCICQSRRSFPHQMS